MLLHLQAAFLSQGMITIVLECIDRLNVYNTAAHFSEFAGEEAAESWKEIVNLLYELLGRIIQMNIKHKDTLPVLNTVTLIPTLCFL